jgi:ComF family protein
MISLSGSILKDLLHLFYPHHCMGCGADQLQLKELLCARCLYQLPVTGFFDQPGNTIERIFYGRVPVIRAGAGFYFTKSSLLQGLLIELKYRNNPEAGKLLGRIIGRMLAASPRFSGKMFLVPLPLHPEKEYKRGYNQATIICEGIAESWPQPLLTDAVIRRKFTETQTQNNRISRWLNMQEVFAVSKPEQLAGQEVLLVDDVITTGATLEACAATMTAAGARVSIATVAYTS